MFVFENKSEPSGEFVIGIVTIKDNQIIGKDMPCLTFMELSQSRFLFQLNTVTVNGKPSGFRVHSSNGLSFLDMKLIRQIQTNLVVILMPENGINVEILFERASFQNGYTDLSLSTGSLTTNIGKNTEIFHVDS